jgi:thymidine phosphorylase
MELYVKRIDISTGDSPVVLITAAAALTLDLHTGDRVLLQVERRSEIAVVNTTQRSFGITDEQAGMFLETANALAATDGTRVTILPAPKPESLQLITDRMDGRPLCDDAMRKIAQDIVTRKLTQVELAYFVAACQMKPLSLAEIISLTNAMAQTGERVHFPQKLVIDKHCIGGVPGNRTSMITVPIMASLGYTVPKTSSRAITSPAGTADTMEVLAEVSMTAERMQQVVGQVGGCVVWGGAVNLAPADDRIITVERPLSIDVDGLLVSSVIAKKLSAGSTHVLIDIPYGPGSKVLTIERAQELAQQFRTVGKRVGLQVLVILTDGSQPIGNGVGPVLEAYDVLAVLKNDPHAPSDLREKSIALAGRLLEFVSHCRRGEGAHLAATQLASGAAYHKFMEIIDAQGRKSVPALAQHTHRICAHRAGRVERIDNRAIAHIARIAGAPVSPGAGLLLEAKVGTLVNGGDILYTIYAQSPEKLANAVAQALARHPYDISTPDDDAA